MTTLIKTILGILTALLVTSCQFDINLGQMHGDGNVVTEDLNITEDFDEVVAGNGWEVFLEKGSTNAVILEADQNLVDAAEIYVKDGKLKIYCEDNIKSATSKKVFVTYSENLTDVSVNSGASLTTKETLTGDDIEFDASSGGTMRVQVSAKNVETDVSSGGVARISGSAERLDASSGGVMDVYASQDLKAEASSGGIINYYGSPRNVDKPKKSYSGGVIRSKE